MPQGESLRVKGFRQLLKATDRAERDEKLFVREAFKKVGDTVRLDATRRFEKYDARSAQGYRTKVRQGGVVVQQSLRRTTNRHPEYAKLQMRKALLPALASKKADVERGVELALEEVSNRFNN